MVINFEFSTKKCRFPLPTTVKGLFSTKQIKKAFSGGHLLCYSDLLPITNKELVDYESWAGYKIMSSGVPLPWRFCSHCFNLTILKERKKKKKKKMAYY